VGDNNSSGWGGKGKKVIPGNPVATQRRILTLPQGRGIHAASMSKGKGTKRLILRLAGRSGGNMAIQTLFDSVHYQNTPHPTAPCPLIVAELVCRQEGILISSCRRDNFRRAARNWWGFRARLWFKADGTHK